MLGWGFLQGWISALGYGEVQFFAIIHGREMRTVDVTLACGIRVVILRVAAVRDGEVLYA